MIPVIRHIEKVTEQGLNRGGHIGYFKYFNRILVLYRKFNSEKKVNFLFLIRKTGNFSSKRKYSNKKIDFFFYNYNNIISHQSNKRVTSKTYKPQKNL